MQTGKKFFAIAAGCLSLGLLGATVPASFWDIEFNNAVPQAEGLFTDIALIGDAAAALDEDNGECVGIALAPASAIRLDSAPEVLAEFDRTGEFTAFIELTLASSEEQVNWNHNLLFTRCRYQEGGKSWLIAYEKWGTLSFTVFVDGREIKLKNFAAQYQKLENQKLKVFASFGSGTLALSVYAADGDLLNRESMEIDAKRIDAGAAAKYFAISGATWSNPLQPGGGFVGTVHRAALWNHALAAAELDTIAKSLGTPVLPQDAIRYQEQAFWEIDREAADNAAVLIPWDKPGQRKIKLLTLSDFAGNIELNGLYHRSEFELDENFAVTDNPDQKERLGIARSSWRIYTKIEGYYSDQVEDKLREGLAKKPEVIMIGRTDWMLLPTDIQDSIKDAIASGAGLVFCYKSARENETLQALLNAVKPIKSDFAVLPYSEIAGLGARAAGAEELPGLYFGNYGKGRVVFLAWDDDTDPTVAGTARRAHYFTYPEPLSKLYNNGWSYEFSQALLLKLVKLAAGEPTAPELAAITIAPTAPATAETLNVTLSTRPGCAATSAEVVVRSSDNAMRKVHGVAAADWTGFALPGLPAGTYSLDVVLRDAKGRAVDFGAAVFNVSGTAELSLTPDAGPFKSNTVSGTYAASGATRLVLRAVDPYGRELYRGELAGMQGRWEFDAALRVTNGVNVELSAYDATGEPLTTVRELVIFHDRSDFENEFTISVWSPPAADYLGSRLLVDLFSYPAVGVYLPQYNAYEESYLRLASAWPFHYGAANVSPYLYAERYYAKADLRDLVRTPCLSDPAYKAQRRAEILRLGKIARDFNPSFYSLGDEPYLVGFWDGVNGRDVCFSEHCTRDLHRFLKNKYGTIDRLNSVWGSNFTAFEEAGPVIFEDAVASGNPAPWVDHRLHMVDVFIGALEEAQDIIVSEIEPGALVGPEGMFPADPFKGYDWYRMGKSFAFIGGYGFAMDPTANHLLNSFRFARESARRISISGWYPDCNPSAEVYSRFDPWGAFLSGQNGLLMWMTMPMFVYVSSSNGINPQGRLTNYWKQTLEEAFLIRNRYFKLLDGMERPRQKKIALYYSRPSEIVSHFYVPDYLWKKQVAMGLFAARQWDTLLSSSGVERHFIADAQVLDGLLRSPGRPEVVILPAITALSDLEVEELRDFVRTGGVLVADVLPGAHDENGTLRRNPALAELFGVSVPERPALKESKTTLRLPNATGAAMLTVTTLANPEAWPSVEGLGENLFLSRKYGAGRTYLTNCLLPDYRNKLARAGRNVPAKLFLQHYLGSSGIFADVPGLENAGPVKNIELATFADTNGAEYVGVLKNARYAEVTPEAFNLEFKTRRHLYNCRSGEYLGFGNRIEGTVDGAHTQLYALLPYRVTGIEVTGLEQARAGTLMELELAVQVKDEARIGRHAVDLQIFDVAGRELVELRRGVALPGGRGRAVLPLAVNMHGEFTLRITDSATGTVAEKKFTIAF
ncbi:MAG: hypothetical protein GX946_06780 [Oligosphaeraceae bacterium]|nr:hypothetical protein [Oligosphaeraceae bacterium]